MTKLRFPVHASLHFLVGDYAMNSKFKTLLCECVVSECASVSE